MKKLFLALVFSLLLFSSIAAARSSIYAPAVDSQGNGVLTTLIAQATPGTGRIRTDIRTSLVSTDTEESIRIAAQAAAKEAGVDLRSYDVNIDIDSQAEIIDGPSGGLALGIIIYNELNTLKTETVNRLRSDLTVTGAIDRDGSIIRVGGVEEKVGAAHQKGLTLMLIASGQSSSDSIDYVVYGKEISDNRLQVIEVPTLHAALEFVYTPDRGRVTDAPEFAIKPVVLIPFSATQRTLHVRAIAQEEIENAKRELQALIAKANAGEDGEIAAVVRAVNSSLRNAQNALDKGYFYTAANSAFLARITIETATAQALNTDEFAAMIDSLEAQQQQYTANKPALTNVNFEPLAGADLRYWWSVAKLEEVKEAFQKNNAVTPGEARDYYTSRAWFQAAQKLANNAKTLGGQEVNESNAREYTLDLIEAAIPIANSSLDSEIIWHYKTARREITQGAYAAAAFDLQYIFSIDSTAKLLENKTIAQALAMLGRTNAANIYPASNSAMWAELFYAHSINSQQENEAAPDPSTIISTFRLREMARDFNATKTTLAQEFISPRPAKNRTTELPTISPLTPKQPEESFPQTPRVPQPQPTVTATITQQLDTGQVIAALLIGIGIIVLIAVAANKLGSPTSAREMLDKLDAALVKGRISETTYRRLREKYKEQARWQVAKQTKQRKKANPNQKSLETAKARLKRRQ